MDWSSVYPDGFHPTRQYWDPSVNRPAKYRRRSDVEHAKYYFIDFRHSSQLLDPSEPRLVLGIECQDQRVPELSEIKPYDPFPVDIFILSDLYYLSFVRVRKKHIVFQVTKEVPVRNIQV